MFEMKEMEKIVSEVKLSTPASFDVKDMENVRYSTPAYHDISLYGEERNGIHPERIPIHSKEVDSVGDMNTSAVSMEGEIHNLAVEHITQEAEMIEMAPSMEVQASMIREEYLNIPELHYENWKELSVEQRVEAMNEIEQKVAQIAMRDPIPVTCEDLESSIMGLNTGDKLIIDEQLMVDDSYEGYWNAMETLFHEGRHSYQQYNLLVKRVEQSDELVNSWIANYKLSYDNGNRLIFKEYGMLRYYTQPLEVDARLFAETVMRELEQ